MDTLVASRREDKTPRGRDLSAHPEAGHAEELFRAPPCRNHAWHESHKSKTSAGGMSPFVVSSNRSFGCFASNHVCALVRA